MLFPLSLLYSSHYLYALSIIFMLFLLSLCSFYYLYALSIFFMLFLFPAVFLYKSTLFPMSHSLSFYLSLTVCFTPNICCQHQ
ncbi:hypothetical protein BDB00DRAFT_859477 [Zychaea mexicana]|uniref:uncharacterized protein n=1 Tax=Zychaea mexicana TaxID=64656 RepID=UPI0022FE96F6|nr:uncharacterized protein BDB00DRAFT_859477 [Zychaea mexicana]KAI9477117.1 hypothetical protein BDB00DRAFT_859477 [Zychaea mexicana]